jgi:hypothetical protein
MAQYWVGSWQCIGWIMALCWPYHGDVLAGSWQCIGWDHDACVLRIQKREGSCGMSYPTPWPAGNPLDAPPLTTLRSPLSPHRSLCTSPLPSLLHSPLVITTTAHHSPNLNSHPSSDAIRSHSSPLTAHHSPSPLTAHLSLFTTHCSPLTLTTHHSPSPLTLTRSRNRRATNPWLFTCISGW